MEDKQLRHFDWRVDIGLRIFTEISLSTIEGTKDKPEGAQSLKYVLGGPVR